MDDMERFRIRNLVLNDVDAQMKGDDRLQIARYKFFLGIKHHMPTFTRAPYHRPFESSESIPGTAIVLNNALSRAMVEIPNQINGFGQMIRKLEAWDLVIDELDHEQVFSLSIEHIEPLTNLAISATQAIRGQMIYATVECGALMNSIIGKPTHWNGQTNTNMKVAKSVAEKWRGWPALAQRLTLLEAEELNEVSGHFRNNFQHGAPRQLVIGLTEHIKWIQYDDGTFSWGIGTQEPIKPGEIIPHLKSAHHDLLKAHEALIELVKEWESAVLTLHT
jgi:hypothetical protein